MEVMHQEAPYPAALADLVGRCRYRKGWTVKLLGMERDPAATHGAAAGGLTLVITTNTVNSYDQDAYMAVRHLFIVPAATYNERAWRRWLFDQFLRVESHECAEFFTIDGEHPFAPNHGPGADPYTIVEYATDTERRTSFRGELNPT